MKVLIVSILLVFCTTFCCGQNRENDKGSIKSVSLDVLQSRRLRYHHVKINISLLNSRAVVSVKSKAACQDKECLKTNIDTIYSVSSNDFFKIENAVTKISSDDIEAAQLTGLDGVTCTIGFGQDRNFSSFTIWSPDSNTKERKLGMYLHACKLILKTAKLNDRRIL